MAASGTSLAAADPSGLIDMEQRTWSTEIIEALALSELQFPELFEPGDIVGELRSEVAKQLNLPAKLPVVAGAGDGQAAGLGAGIDTQGRAYLNLGTAVVSGVLSRSYRTDRAFRTLYGALPDTYFLETDLKGGTFTLNWLAEHLGDAQSSAEKSSCLARAEEGAAQLPPLAGGLMLVPYFAGVMNPYWDDQATGILLGLDGSHGIEHFYRAIIEGIAFEQRLHSEGVDAALGEPIREFVTVGGGAQSDLWCQILADVLERPIKRSKALEASALGAGMLAAAASNLHPSLSDASREMSAETQSFEPEKDSELYATAYRRIYRGLYPGLKNSLKALSELR